ncbi:MAG: hypothetical protein RR410_03690 [Alistipes sp.]
MSGRKFITLAINVLSTAIAALIVARHTTTIYPYPIVASLLAVNILTLLVAWKHIGYTRRGRTTEAMMLIVGSLVPLATFYSLISTEGDAMSTTMQIVAYCAGQVVWVVAIEITPDWVGGIRQRRAEERALSGKQKFASRDEVIRENKREK